MEVVKDGLSVSEMMKLLDQVGKKHRAVYMTDGRNATGNLEHTSPDFVVLGTSHYYLQEVLLIRNQQKRCTLPTLILVLPSLLAAVLYKCKKHTHTLSLSLQHSRFSRNDGSIQDDCFIYHFDHFPLNHNC